MTIVLIITIIILVIFILLFIVQAPVSKYKLNINELEKYLKYASEALADNGSIQIKPTKYAGYFNLTKKCYNTKSDVLIFRMSFGYLDSSKLEQRSLLNNFKTKLDEKGISHKASYSNKKNLIHDIRISFDCENIMLPNSISEVIKIACESLGLKNEEKFVITIYGKFKLGYVPEDGVVIEHKKAFKFGEATGSAIRKILGL